MDISKLAVKVAARFTEQEDPRTEALESGPGSFGSVPTDFGDWNEMTALCERLGLQWEEVGTPKGVRVRLTLPRFGNKLVASSTGKFREQALKACLDQVMAKVTKTFQELPEEDAAEGEDLRSAIRSSPESDPDYWFR